MGRVMLKPWPRVEGVVDAIEGINRILGKVTYMLPFNRNTVK